MAIFLKIVPLFLVIAIGYFGARRGFFPPGFVGPANRLAYYLAIPALILRAVAHAPIDETLQPVPALLAVGALLLGWLGSVAISKLPFISKQASPAHRASWIQCAIHGNQGLMGLAVVYYALGQPGLAAAGLIATGVIIFQNLFSVITLTRWGDAQEIKASYAKTLGLNPIILATILGISLALAGFRIPEFLDRTLEILAGLGVPLALLIVGANLAETRLGGSWSKLAAMQGMKLLMIPALGLVLLWIAGVDSLPLTVAVVLLSSPSATITVIMANQMGGDPELSSQAISASHALSVLSYSLWLWLLIP
jgi:predicted permease